MENKKLYLNATNYNMLRVKNELLKIAVAAGAKIVKSNFTKENITFFNRSISEKIHKNDEFIAALEKHGKNADHLKEENENLKKDFEKSAYISCESPYFWGGISTKFVLNDFLYDFSQEDNPFFPAHIRKIKLVNNSYTGDFYCDTDESHNYFNDNIFSIAASENDIQEIANDLFNFILATNESQEAIEKEKKRVSNTYNSGYHYETITKRSHKKTVLEFE